MNVKIITISREFGSGGHSIGKSVAKKLGWKYYDQELVNKISEESSFAKEFIETRGEYATTKSDLLYSLFENFGATTGSQSINDKLYITQANIIKEIAQGEPCVIVGRCANFILRNRVDVLNVFIHADTDFKAKRIVELYGETKDDPEKRLKDKDGKRAVYYKYYTGEKWGIITNYDLSVNSGKIGIEKCSDIIVSTLKTK